MLKKLFRLSSIITLVSVPISHAGVINVVNENNKELLIKIEAIGDSSAILKQTIPAENVSSFSINSDQLNGKNNFTIMGDTSTFTSGDKCKNLSTNSDYKVTFTTDTVGITCIAEEIS
ncbi:MAG: hypothetical protein BGO77_03575 [Caedibacter sp. 37-49]|mgnify:CR=1 FL=1|nr:MAG: hypothetical protein BGO77_03575 [Caedibacter sp. 37-49]